MTGGVNGRMSSRMDILMDKYTWVQRITTERSYLSSQPLNPPLLLLLLPPPP